MPNPYILGDEEEDYYDEWGPIGSDETDYWDIQIPEEIVQEQAAYDYPGYVRQGDVQPAQPWEPYGLYTTPEGRFQPRIAFDPAQGLAPLHKLALTPEEVEAGMEAIFSPFLSEEDRRALMEAPLTPSPLARGTAGVSQGLLNTAESLTSPINLALMVGAGGLSGIPLAARGLSGAFALDMASQVPAQAQELGEAWESGDPERIARAATELGANAAFTTAAGAHALKRPIAIPGEIREAFQPSDNPRVRAIEEALNRPLTERERYAIQERQTAEILRGLPEQPEQYGRQVPAEEGPRGVPPSQLPRGDAESILRAEEARASEIPLTPAEERFTRAEIIPRAKPEIAKESTSRFKNPHGDPMGTTYHATPEDWTRWKEVQGALNEALKANDTDRFQEVLGENERIKNKYGGMPPEPPKVVEAGKIGKVAETSPLDFQKVSFVDKEGHRAADPELLRKQLESGDLVADQVGGALLKHLLTPSEAHPIKAIRIIDMRPEDLQAITGHPVSYRGRFLLERDNPAGVIEILTRDDAGNPITHAEFVKTLNHELTHNSATSKFDDAPAHIKAAAESLLAQARARAKGTPMERHNALSDVHELVAEGTSAREVQDWLIRQKYEGKGPAKNFWDRFVNIVRGILGVSKEVTSTMLDEVMRISGELEPIQRRAKQVTTERFGEERFALSRSQQQRMQEDRHSMVNRVREFFGGLPARLRAAPYRMQGREAPMTYSKAPESANKLVEHASAQVAAPEVARAMASEVLGDKFKDADFGKRLGAVLVEDRLRGMRDEMRRNRDPDWRNVTTIIGHPNSPFRVEADFRRALADPEIRAAIQRHKQTVQRVAQAQHQLARGDLAGRGTHTDAFVNLEAVLPDVAEHLGGGAGRGNLMNPLRRKSRFSKKAKGTAQEYHLDYRRIAERMIEGNFNEATKRRLYGQLIQDGLAVMTKPGESPPTGFNAHPQPFTIERKGTPAGGGKAQTFVRRLWVNKDIYPEVRQALNVDGRVGEAALVNAFNGLNQIQLAGPTDAVWHIANMVASIAGSQGGRNVLVDAARKVPGVNLADALGRTVASAIKVLRDNPEVQKQIGELAKIGAMRPQQGRGIVPLGEEYAKLRLLHPGNMIQLLDRAGRLVRDDLYKNMVRRGLVEDTVANRRLWVNQMGQYNGRLMGGIMRWMKEQGVSPFVVAGTNFNRMAMRRMALSQGLKAKNPAAAAQMKAVDAFGVLATLVVVPSILNYLLTSNPSGRPGTKFGQIDTGQDTKDGKHIVIDPGQWTGLRRGMRITGAQGLIEGLREEQRGKRIATRVAGDILGGAIHPWTGPAVHGVSVAATGYSPSGYKESENPNDVGANLLAALEQLNPIAKAIIEGKKEHRGAAAQIGLSLGGAIGVKAARPLTAYDRMRNLHEKWLADHPDRRIREKFERFAAATLPTSQYLEMNKFIRNKDPEATLEALQKVREVARDEDIFKRMIPTIGEGINEEPKPLFHESEETEVKFLKSLTPEQRKLYDEARRDRIRDFKFFIQVWKKRGPRPPQPQTAPVPAP